jgi:transposase
LKNYTDVLTSLHRFNSGCPMLGTQDRWQDDLFVVGSLRELIPEDHLLRRIDKQLDLGWLRDDVANCYCEDNGRPSIDPEAAVRLMLAGFVAGIVHDRKLMREAQVNLAIRWFAGYRLHDTSSRPQLPDPYPAALGRRAVSSPLREDRSGLRRRRARDWRRAAH